MKVLHIITSLIQGGAEAVLYRLVTAALPGVEHVVVSLTDDGYYGPRLRDAGVRVHTLDSPRGWVTPVSLLRLRRIMTATAPDVVQTWMYHADLVGGLVARWAGVRSVVWGIRNSNLDEKSSLSARVVAQICACLSRRLPAAIVCCSEQAAQVHQAIGYCKEKFAIIPNGYDLTRFAPNETAREQVRTEWGIAANEILLGLVARWDPQKDHANLLLALAQLTAKHINLRCVLVGSGMVADNIGLAGLINDYRLNHVVILAGPRDDIPAVMNALDLHVLPSAYGEAFPNVVAEAMACGTPCVATNVGDAALIVGETGWVTPPRDAIALAIGVEAALTDLRKKCGSVLLLDCRRRIEENFSLDRMSNSYMKLWEGLNGKK